MHEALGESKQELKRLGFEIDSFLAPYDNFDDYSREFAAEYYDGIVNAEHGSRVNDPEEFDPFHTQRDYFIEFTTSDHVKEDLNIITYQGTLGVIGAHTFKENVTEKESMRLLNGSMNAESKY
ncbi:polysaccharide deacetylase [Halalkalicoccus tibetensis]|uniref:Polysaccharide deacetylase n=1 Tax=Halalkalicoccus tibetensis TaxID=175632 RepID=A0ABD5V4U9_9EURY